MAGAMSSVGSVIGPFCWVGGDSKSVSVGLRVCPMSSLVAQAGFMKMKPLISMLVARRASMVCSVATFPSPKILGKPTVLVAERFGIAGIELLEPVANVDCSYNVLQEDLCEKISLSDALIGRRSTKVASNERLKFAGGAGVSIDNVGLHAAPEVDSLVVNAPTTNTVAAAEHGVALTTSVACFAPQSNTSMKAGSGAGEGVLVLVLGGGGREHSLCFGLKQSPKCAGVFCAPGNAGISNSGDATCISTLDITDSAAIVSFCEELGVGLVVVGPEGPLVAGVVDDLNEAGIPVFGPSAEAAMLEGSKDFMKRLCNKYGIPTAKYASFTDAEEAKKYIMNQGMPIVVKANGLAAGKGVVVAITLDEAFEAVDAMLTRKVFGSAGGLVIVEEFLEGEEVSFFAIVDGKVALPLASAQDHKRAGDGDTGPNTGGMGAYSPALALTPDLEKIVMESIILPTVEGMAAENSKFVGILYAGIIIEAKTGLPKLLEYNVRFGDPECQVLMMRFQGDLVELLLYACSGNLRNAELQWADNAALVVVMASKGYPGNYKSNTMIKNLDEAELFNPGVKIFHAGTALDLEQNVIAVGGRVLGVTAVGKDIADAQRKAYEAVEDIVWPEGFCRRDIGWRAVTGAK